jgi:hypothetical protein
MESGVGNNRVRNSLILLTTDGDFRFIHQLAQENWARN